VTVVGLATTDERVCAPCTAVQGSGAGHVQRVMQGDVPSSSRFRVARPFRHE